MNKRSRLGLLGLGLLVLVSRPTFAQNDGQGDSQLTPNQHKSLSSLYDRYESRRQDLALRIQQRRLELANLLRKDEPDKAAVQAKLAEYMELERERQELSIDEIFDAKALLKPAQWRAFRNRLLRNLVIPGAHPGH